MRGLVSFSVFGDDPNDIYFGGALRNAEMYRTLYPEWVLRFYVGKTAHKILEPDLSGWSNVEIVPMDAPEDQTATFWRFLALRDRSFDFHLFRDTDGRPHPRERAAVEEWLASNQDFHVMRDHPRHGAVMLAGLWGVKSGSHMARINRRLPEKVVGDYYQVDQDFLRAKLWPLARRSLMAHVDCRYLYGSPGITRPFLTPRNNLDFFAGEGRFADNRLRFPEHRLEIPVDPRRVDVSAENTAKILRRRAGRAI